MKLPLIQKSPSTVFQADALAAAKKIKANYEPIVRASGKSAGVHPAVIVGFMVIENDGVKPELDSYSCTEAKRAKGDCYTGLMQMGAETAYDTIRIQYAKKQLNAEEASIVQKYLPGLLKVGAGLQPFEQWKLKIYNALKKPEFSIWIGTMHIKQLMMASNNRLDHVIVKYNRGVGNFQKEVVKTGNINSDTTALVNALNANKVPESGSYIVKFVGINGAIVQAQAAGF